jgi:hypothetical protein
VLSVPDVTDRYFVIEMVCMDADNFAYVGSYATGVKAGNFLIARPHWNGKLPDGVLDILPRSRTDTVLLLGRTGVNNSSEADLAIANAIQEKYILTPLSDWPGSPTPFTKPVMIPYGADYNHTAGALCLCTAGSALSTKLVLPSELSMTSAVGMVGPGGN